MSQSEFDPDGCLGAERKAPAAKQNVHPTEGEVLAQLVARGFKIRNGDLPWKVEETNDANGSTRVMVSVELRGWRARKLLQSIDAACGCQGARLRSHEDDFDAVG
jgi:hypothetical protein